MRFLIASLLLIATLCRAAVPSYSVFRGSGGILVTTNPPTGLIVIDGSGVFTSSGTNATISTSTNGVLVAVASTNINFIEGTNMIIRATNQSSRTDISFNTVLVPDEVINITEGYFLTQIIYIPELVTSNLVITGSVTFYGASGLLTNFHSLSTSNAVSKPITNSVDDGNVVVFGFQGGTNVVLTMNASNIVINAAGGAAGGGNVAPPLNSVQFNSNSVQQGSADFVFVNGVATVGQGVEVTSGSFVLNGGVTALVAWNGLGRIRWDANGVARFEDDSAISFNRINLGGSDAGFPALARTNGDFILLGGNGAFGRGESTNRFLLSGGIVVHTSNELGSAQLRMENLKAPNSVWDLAVDTNPETTVLGLRRNTTYLMTWEPAGNVGIGTTNPGNRLDVEGRVAIGEAYSGTSTAPTDGLIVVGNVGIATASPTNTLDVNGNVSFRADVFLPVLPTNASPVAFLAVDGGGKVYETAAPTGGAGTPGGSTFDVQWNSNNTFYADSGVQTRGWDPGLELGPFLMVNNSTIGGTTTNAIIPEGFGTISAHTLGLYANRTQFWDIPIAGHLIPSSAPTTANTSNRLDIGSWAKPVRTNWLSTLSLKGQTNQIIFGATNIAPASAAAPTKWISVQVAGESGTYRLPLYE